MTIKEKEIVEEEVLARQFRVRVIKKYIDEITNTPLSKDIKVINYISRVTIISRDYEWKIDINREKKTFYIELFNCGLITETDYKLLNDIISHKEEILELSKIEDEEPFDVVRICKQHAEKDKQTVKEIFDKIIRKDV